MAKKKKRKKQKGPHRFHEPSTLRIVSCRHLPGERTRKQCREWNAYVRRVRSGKQLPEEELFIENNLDKLSIEDPLDGDLLDLKLDEYMKNGVWLEYYLANPETYLDELIERAREDLAEVEVEVNYW